MSVSVTWCRCGWRLPVFAACALVTGYDACQRYGTIYSPILEQEWKVVRSFKILILGTLPLAMGGCFQKINSITHTDAFSESETGENLKAAYITVELTLRCRGYRSKAFVRHCIDYLLADNAQYHRIIRAFGAFLRRTSLLSFSRLDRIEIDGRLSMRGTPKEIMHWYATWPRGP